MASLIQFRCAAGCQDPLDICPDSYTHYIDTIDCNRSCERRNAMLLRNTVAVVAFGTGAFGAHQIYKGITTKSYDFSKRIKSITTGALMIILSTASVVLAHVAASKAPITQYP
jgi:hypothetical protein